MDRPDNKALLVLIFITSIVLTTSSQFPEPYVPFCDTDKGTFIPNNPFGNNLKNLLESIPTRTSLAGGFYNMSIGNGRDKVYGKALCRGDVNKIACTNCLENAAQEILSNCTSEEAIYWYALCQIHYSYAPITEIYTGKFPLSNDEKEIVSDTIHFPVIVKDFMHNLTYRVSSSPLMFATGEIKISNTEKIYGLEQCTRDVSQKVCRSCFDTALLELEQCCSLRKGGTVFSRNCNVRFEMHRFYHDASKSENAWKKWVVGTVATLAFALVLVMSYCVLRLLKNKARKTDVKETNEEDRNRVMTIVEPRIVGSEELIFMEFSIVKAATENFSGANKLGQGGFGTVYKGILPDGKEIAVKRLSRKSWQGKEEFKE